MEMMTELTHMSFGSAVFLCVIALCALSLAHRVIEIVVDIVKSIVRGLGSLMSTIGDAVFAPDEEEEPKQVRHHDGQAPRRRKD